jgi:hypothetical protein
MARESENKALDLIRKHGPQTCTEIGCCLWGGGMIDPQCHALPAGRLMRRMERRGLVVRSFDIRCKHFVWGLADAKG